MKTTTRDVFLMANKEGLKFKKHCLPFSTETEDEHCEFIRNYYRSWYTPLLKLAYDFGVSGVDLSTKDVVKGWRYGKASWCGISQNHVTGESEKGLSLAAIGDDKPHWEAMFLSDRPKYEYEGILVEKGSDGEPVILPFGFEVYDD